MSVDVTLGTRPPVPSPLSPETLGPVRLRNRIIKAATSEGRSPEGLVTQDLIDFHVGFARGGVGMTTVAYCSVAQEGRSAPGQIIMSAEAVPGLQRLTAAVHAEGAAISAQLGHAGVVASRAVTGTSALAPSTFLNPTSFQLSKEITREQMRGVVGQFRDAALVAVDSGFDAVELHFGHLYLPSSFMSPWINKRRDEYGGSIENRTRFAREIAQAVKDAVGDRIAVIAKMSMDDGIKGSIWLDESLQSAQLLDSDKVLDAIELTMGSSVKRQMFLFRGDVPVDGMAAVMKEPFKTGVKMLGKRILGEYPYYDLYMLEAARQVRPVVKNAKLILLGGVNNMLHLEAAMAEGFEFAAMGRALLREPDLINRLAEDPTKPGLCIHCNKCMFTVYGKTHCVLAEAVQPA
ncbi:NADH:flavin oxidoreductase [Arthrobacter yangruifuii]|uniref:NADH:flavin oxidoreductase n=1 Tax=Arthrobacter yangruifuii TaxID=2606616 RepID=A0A5N6MHI2_9MICC|nr:NADH:flavin oxidoreductase [Arthrobacter yangruifuii]KAD3633047.1 NADH:flavin oxidoreductase [Arthrobacter yangruifuii]